MTGLFLVVFFVISMIFFIMSRYSRYNDENFKIVSVISLCLGVIWLISIPISRIDSKTNAEYCKILQETIDINRQGHQDLNALERVKIIEDINNCNKTITTWKVKGQKWYNNKWYYHSLTQQVKYIK